MTNDEIRAELLRVISPICEDHALSDFATRVIAEAILCSSIPDQIRTDSWEQGFQSGGYMALHVDCPDFIPPA